MNKNSIYTEENIFTFENKQYEVLFNHPYNEKFRVIFSDDDYDYVEEQEFIAKLYEEFKRQQ